MDEEEFEFNRYCFKQELREHFQNENIYRFTWYVNEYTSYKYRYLPKVVYYNGKRIN